MRLRAAFVVCGFLLCAPAAVHAQYAPSLLLGAGLQSPVDRDLDAGLHMFAALDFGRTRMLRPRLDVLLERSDTRNVLTLANVVLASRHRTVSPYLVAGGGVYFDDGAPAVLALGGGVDVSWRVPLALELRTASAPERHLLLTLALRP